MRAFFQWKKDNLQLITNVKCLLRKKESDELERPFGRLHIITLNDIDVASTLICKGYELVDITPVSHNKVTFVSKNHPAITDAVEGFGVIALRSVP